MTVFRRFYDNPNEKPDAYKRRTFFLHWEEPDGVFRPEPSKLDGEPVGYRRAQIFFTDPAAQDADAVRRGDTIVEPEGPDPYAVARAAKNRRS